MRYLTVYSEYLHGIQEWTEYPHIYDLLMRLDCLNDCIDELKSLENLEGSLPLLKISKETNYFFGLEWDTWGMDTVKEHIAVIKHELKSCYGIDVDLLINDDESLERAIDGQMTIEEL